MQTYQGSCHCGAVAYEVELDPIASAMSCNCSMCRRAGSLLAFAPASRFRLVRGEDSLTLYRFNKHVIEHVFCKSCGIKSFARGKMPDGTPTIAINVRCLDGVDPDKLELKHVDGASR
jgi:hypothetical protein